MVTVQTLCSKFPSFLLASNRLNPYMIKTYMFSYKYFNLYKINIQKPAAPSVLSGHVVSLLAYLLASSNLVATRKPFISFGCQYCYITCLQANINIDVHCFHFFISDKFSCPLLYFSVIPHINLHHFLFYGYLSPTFHYRMRGLAPMSSNVIAPRESWVFLGYHYCYVTCLHAIINVDFDWFTSFIWEEFPCSLLGFSVSILFHPNLSIG